MESQSVCVFKEKFERKLSEQIFKENSVSITSVDNYAQLINEVMEAKAKQKKTSLDHRRLKRYDILTVGTATKLIMPLNTSVNNEVKYFVHNGEIFEILKNAHIETGHGGLHKMYNAVKSKYVNI
uniref:Integrase zinc-binding domain-containing protein n=1 Tax=Photinus pyralis TaxID=7054 RepID=A0A1Y1K3Q1_PHOPY